MKTTYPNPQSYAQDSIVMACLYLLPAPMPFAMIAGGEHPWIKYMCAGICAVLIAVAWIRTARLRSGKSTPRHDNSMTELLLSFYALPYVAAVLGLAEWTAATQPAGVESTSIYGGWESCLWIAGALVILLATLHLLRHKTRKTAQAN